VRAPTEKAKVARSDYQAFQKFLKNMAEPGNALLQHIEELRQKAERFAAERDEAKPKEQKPRSSGPSIVKFRRLD
jgi:hypothetical protein